MSSVESFPQLSGRNVRETHVCKKVHLGEKEERLFRIVKTTFVLGALDL